MADVIRLTEDWTTITQGAVQPLSTALDVQEYDVLDLIAYTGIQAATEGALSLTLKLVTGMSLLSPTAWVTVPNSTLVIDTDSLSTVRAFTTLTGGFYRYVRWQAAISNVAVARFHIEGVGRRYR
jgi:hypothetical protein